MRRRDRMKRLLSLLLTILLGAALQAKPQDCCDRASESPCHHSKAPRHKPPCAPAVSACPESSCLTNETTLASAAVPRKRVNREVAPQSPRAMQRRADTQMEPRPVLRDTGQPVSVANLYLMHRVLVI